MFEGKSLVLAETAKTPTWFWTGDKGITINQGLIKELREYSKEHNTNCRICLHKNPKETCHTMLICERKGMNIPPHFHEDKSDFVFVLDGELNCLEFENDGKLLKTNVIEQGNGYKSPEGMIHAIAIKSEYCIYIETSKGPFVPETDAQFPNWAKEWHKKYCTV